MRNEVVLRVGAKVLIPFILLFGLYVQFHGEVSPGGGFQAGVICAAAFILYGLVFGLETAQRVLPLGVVRTLAALGVLIYSGTGVVSLLLGSNFMDYDALAHDPSHGQHYGIMSVEMGVLVTVFGVMVVIFYAFAGRGASE
ncbi:MAG TPA: Na(+)/H(+) antiporter subunit B [Longimicrobiaceae bacterium]|nr:Na(+)/H(+) antiporter subunit B [Longimicrobiaceae bacterium]